MHYHSTCFGCLTPDQRRWYAQSEGEHHSPGGTAFVTREHAQEDADHENALPYMRGWAGHLQIVAPCKGRWCRPYTTPAKLEWQRQREEQDHAPTP